MNHKKISLIMLLSVFAQGARADNERLRYKDERIIAFEVRKQADCHQTLNRPPSMIEKENNGDDLCVKDFAGSFSKGLKHHTISGILTESGQENYKILLQALRTGDQKDFNAIKRAGTRKFLSPQAAFDFSFEGCDSALFHFPPAPKLTSPEAAADLIEVYLQAICRDVEFVDYFTGIATDDNGEGGSFTQTAADVLESLGKAYRGPSKYGIISTSTLFRGVSKGNLVGPYISQFLYKSLQPYSQPLLEQMQYIPIASPREFGLTISDFVSIQNGNIPQPYNADDFGAMYGETSPRYVISGRDLATIVHNDAPYQLYYNAINILQANNCPLSPFLPYQNGTITNEDPFCNMGIVDINAFMARVSLEALKVAWAQKWRANRRLRPEAMAGLVNNAKLTGDNKFHLDQSLFAIHDGIDYLALVMQHNVGQQFLPENAAELGTTNNYLLGQVYPEGSPMDPSFPSGHGVVGGACTTIIKAFYKDTTLIIDLWTPIIPFSNNPYALRPLTPEEGSHILTIGSELDKLASNAAMGRNWAGINYRSDADEGVELGQEVAIRYLQDVARMYVEQTFEGFELTKRDGKRIRITANEVIPLN